MTVFTIPLALGLLLADEAAPALGCYGDPLPAGASARLGTVRLRHTNHLQQIAFAPDGKTVVSVGFDGVRVWETGAGKLVRHFGDGERRFERAASLSADGKRLALTRHHAGSGGPVDVWDVATGKLLHTLGKGHDSLVRFAPDGKRLATLFTSGNPVFGGSIPYEVEIWDAATGQRLSQWKGRKESVTDMQFSTDGKQLLLGGFNKMIVIHDAASGKETRPIDGLPSAVHRLVLSPQGDCAAFIELKVTEYGAGSGSWGAGERVFLVDLRTRTVIRRWTVKNAGAGFSLLTGLAFSPDGNQLAACPMDAPIHIYDLQSGEQRQLHSGRMHSGGLAFSADGRILAVGNGGRVVRLLDAATGADRVTDKGPQGAVTALTTAADGRTAYAAAEDGTIHRWDAQSGRELGRFVGHKARATNLALVADGGALCSLSWDKTVRLWDLNSGKDHLLLEDRNLTWWSSFVLSPDGKTLALATYKELLLLDLSTGNHRHRLATKTQIFSTAFTADGSVVMALTGERKICRWETATGHRLRDLSLSVDMDGPHVTTQPTSLHAGEVIVFSPDGRWIVHAFDKKFLRLLDVSLQRQVQRTANLPDSVTSIFFAPDGRTLTWAEESGTIHWLELATWSERRRFSGHAGVVRQMAFTRDGKRLLSGSEDTTALAWELWENAPAALSAPQRDACWTDLADRDAAKAYRAMCRLIAAPADALALLRLHLKPSDGVNEKRIAQLIADLDSDAFAVLEKATEELRKRGELAEPACRKALAERPSLEMSRRLQELLGDTGQRQWRLCAEDLRQLRALEVLGRLDTPEARRLLETLAEGAEGARQTQEARAAVQRLRSARPATPQEGEP